MQEVAGSIPSGVRIDFLLTLLSVNQVPEALAFVTLNNSMGRAPSAEFQRHPPDRVDSPESQRMASVA